MGLNQAMTAVNLVQTELTQGVLTLTLTRPESLNSLTRDLRTELLSALRHAAEDEAVRVVVLTGAGRGFCVGQDLREHVELLHEGSDAPFTSVRETYNPIARTMASMPKPIIARLNGIAAGAGLSLAMLADFRLAAESARLATSFAGIALSCDTGASWTLQRLVGPGRARELLFDPTPIDARRAETIGLVTRTVADHELDDAVNSLARRLADGPTMAYAAMREALTFAASSTLGEALDFEETRMITTGASEDHRAAVEAFLEKRPPRFSGS